jgi:hypothetical protein
MKSPKKQKKRTMRVNQWKCELTNKGITHTCFATSYERLISYAIPEAIRRNFKLKAPVMCSKENQSADQIWQGRATSACGAWVWWRIVDTGSRVQEAARLLGSIGGSNGKGAKKRRGNSDYYNNLRLKGLIIRRKNKLKKLDAETQNLYHGKNVEN